jgi:hypothetical protein
MDKNLFRLARPLLIVFIFLSAFFFTGRNWLEKKGIDQDVLLMGNLILWANSLLAFYITSRSFRSPNPHVFVRAMYGSFIIKFFVVAIVAFIYIMWAGKNVNKPALIICAGLYILYTVLETRALLKLLKQKKNA